MKRSLLFVAGVTLAMAALTVSCVKNGGGGDDGPDGPDGPEIYWSVMDVIIFTDEDTRRLCVMKPDGTGIRVVEEPTNPADADYPYIRRGVLSPDGSKVVGQDGDKSQYVYDLTNKTATLLKASADEWKADEAVWSPDGKTILYCNCADNDCYILETMAPDGSGRRAITGEGYHLGAPAYTPDGKTIVASNYADNKYICTMKADGSGITKIVEAAVDTRIFWAYPLSNSRIIYFSFDESGENTIVSLCACDIDGDNITTLQILGESEMSWYLSANHNASVIFYQMYDADFLPHNFIRTISGNTLGTATELPVSGLRFMFGRIQEVLYNALPTLNIE